MKRMKKFFPAFLAFLLVFSSVGPLPGVAAGFPGTISIVDKNNIQVVMDGGNAVWKITLHKKDTGVRVGELSGENTSFTDTPPGLYEVRAEKIGSVPNVIEISQAIIVEPRPISVKNDVITEPYKMIIKNVIPGSEVHLYKPNSQTPYKTQKPNADNIVIFDSIDANKRYYVTHFVNGVNSIPSGDITVEPAAVKLEWIKDSGATNNLGEIKVTGTKDKNTLIIYRAENESGNPTEYKQITAKGPITSVSGLKDGVYSIIQTETEDHLQSEMSNKVVINNGMKPTIDLEKPIYELFYNVEGQNKYVNPGYKVTNKNGVTSVIQYNSLSCTPENKLRVSVSIEYKGGVIGNNQTPNPGKYNAIYTATDCDNQQLFDTAIREVIVYPEKIKVKETVDSLAYHGNSPIERHQFGSITVENVFNNADLYLYQDPSETDDLNKARKVREIKNLNENTYKFQDVPVGKGYFVFQEVAGVKSKFSERIEIKDTTPPEILLNTKDGSINIDLEVGDTFTDPGFTAVDNIGIAEEIVTFDPSPVNTNQPGVYTITYKAKDTAGLPAKTETRTVTVKPKPVIATGSTADIGEVGVLNVFPGTSESPTNLKLYKIDENNTDHSVEIEAPGKFLKGQQTTFVFTGVVPGRYYVTQTVKGQQSRQSNIVEVVDIDKPFIKLIGPENINLTMDSEFAPYYTADNLFKDPGITAEDYLSNTQNPLTLTSTLTSVNTISATSSVSGFSTKHPDFRITEPGTYKIKYTAKAKRGAEAQSKYRTITVAPPKPGEITATQSTIEVKPVPNDSKNKGIYSHSTTKVNLYNAYGQLVKSQQEANSNKTVFDRIQAGIGYYVTQTVNGIESQPSLPVNVSVYEDAKPTALITSFNFQEVDAISVIDQKAEKITVTVPKTANLKSLTPIITSIGTVTPNPQVKTDFSDGKPKSYSVVNSAGSTTTTKTYSVTVKHATNSSAGSLPLEKDGVLTPLSPSVSLSPTEMELAKAYGVTFITKDKKAEAHVPSSNIIESGHSTFTLKQSLAGESYEISFGNLSRFMQPIELKLPKSETKVLAKLVDGYTVAMPSATTSTSTTGLVDEPGTYALVDSVDAPRINPAATGSATYTLQLALLETAGTIYYTTSSKDISFTSSALSNATTLKNKYVATASPADILKWTKYMPNDKISTPTGELYAVVVKGNQISQITALEAALPVDWSKNIPSYDTHKVLNINFNARVDREALYSSLIYVLDDATNEKVDTTLQMSSDGKTIYVVPQKAYTRGKQYTLHIDRQFKGNTKNKEFLKKSLLQTFIIN